MLANWEIINGWANLEKVGSVAEVKGVLSDLEALERGEILPPVETIISITVGVRTARK